MTTRDQAVSVMQGWVGLSKADLSHLPIIDIYNSQYELPRGYAVQPWDDYCATAVSAVFVRLDICDIAPTECSVQKLIEAFQAIGRWVEDDSFTPRPGDLLCYDWNDDGKGDCIGWADHVGMVEAVDGDTIYMIEGNMAGGVVGRKPMAVNARYIRGYCCPDYESKDIGHDPIQDEIDALPDWSRPTIQKLHDRGIMEGDGQTLGLTHDLTRVVVMLDKAGVWDK